MPQVSSIRLLLSSTNHPTSLLKPSSLSTLSLLFRPKTPKPQNRPLSFTVFSSYSKKSCGYSNFSRGNCSWSRESEKRDKGSAMEVTESVKYNKKRTEGRDKSGKPKKQLHLKVRKLNPVNTICYFQILGTGMDTHDTSPSVLLFFDKQRFIFNAGEGLQRFCTEHKIKLSKIDHIFFSRVCSETAGGLPGLLLTLAGMGDEGIAVNVWGPSDLKYLVDAMGSFIPKAAIVNTHSFGPPPGSNIKEFDDPIVLIDDEVVKILAFLLKPKLGFDETMEAKVSDPKSEIALKPGDISVIYACELPEIQGKFDPKKAAALGLKPGPKYRELQVGNSVKSDHQNIMVHPSDVLGPSIPGPVVLLVDCPTPSHLQELSSLQSLNTYYVNTPETRCKTVNCVIHLSPAAVVNTTDYQIWMSRFGGAQHIMAGHEMRNIEVPILKASARIAARLNYLCPQIFPAPGFWSLPNLKLLEPCSGSKKEALVSKHCQSISAENLLKFHCRPHAQLGLDQSSIPNTVTSSEVINELLLELPEILETSKQVTKLWNEGDSRNIQTSTSTEQGNRMIEEPWLNENEESWLNEKEIPDCLEDVTREDMEIVFLGTGSSQPSKYRNVSSILINLFSKGTLLLDCGEGTLGQLKRRFGVEGADDAIRALKCIWISHIHADHHTGLARILAQRRDLLKGIPHEPIVVVGPRKLKVFLDAYQKLEDLDMQFLDCRHTTESSLEIFEKSNQEQLPPEEEIENREQKIDSTYTLFGRGSRMESYWKRQNSASLDVKMTFPVLRCLKNALREAGLDGLESVPVVHCPQAFGVVLKGEGRVNRVGKFVPGWKVVYSGDTRPCPELVKASRGATVLIHEATFEDGMLDEAIARNHSTTKEAVEVGHSAGAYRIILTHFSQRYPKIPVLDDENRMHKTCIAFDLMSVNLADLHVLPKVVPYLKLLFRDEMIFEESEEVEDVASAAE